MSKYYPLSHKVSEGQSNPKKMETKLQILERRKEIEQEVEKRLEYQKLS